MPIWAYSTSMGELKSMVTTSSPWIAELQPQDHVPLCL